MTTTEGGRMNEQPTAENDAPRRRPGFDFRGRLIPLDPIEPTVIRPGLAAIPLSPTLWDDAEDGQCAVTPDGTMWQRREGLWYAHPWWQLEDAEQIIAVCAEPDAWAYGNGWPRKMIEEAHGPLTYVIPPEGSDA